MEEQSEEQKDKVFGFLAKLDQVSGLEDRAKLFQNLKKMYKLQDGLSLSKSKEFEPKKYIKFKDDYQLMEKTEREFSRIDRYAQDKYNHPKKSKHERRQSLVNKKSNNSSDSHSDVEVGKKIKISKPQLSSKDYLKLFNQMNQTHDGDRERAVSIVANLRMPKTKAFKDNPLFNKDIKNEKNLNLHFQDLIALSQVQSQDLNILKDANQHDDEIFSYNMIKEVQEQMNLEKKLTNIRNKNKELNKVHFNQFLKKIGFKPTESNADLIDETRNENQLQYQQQLTKFQKLLNQIIEQRKRNQEELALQASGRIVQYEDQSAIDFQVFLPKNASNLTKEVQKLKPIQIRKLFSEKMKELEKCRQSGNLNQFDSDTLQIKQKKADSSEYRQYVKEQLIEGNQVLIDKSLEYSVKLPVMWKEKLNQKYKIKENDIEPFFHEKKDLQKIEEEKIDRKRQTVFDINLKEYIKQRQSIAIKIDQLDPQMKIVQRIRMRQNLKHKKTNSNSPIPTALQQKNYYLDSSVQQLRDSSLNSLNTPIRHNQSMSRISQIQQRSIKHNDSSILSYLTSREENSDSRTSLKSNPVFEKHKDKTYKIYDSSRHVYENFEQIDQIQ
ncbi:UNKNOWN [Stylonychia lemnae]|uniref:Uncharacterized protein n=1 Tax=Stylonychia lemnae TaxID=5949 RepID=A0A077ZMN8_STYLE|nr:UNKNOWN [Stylonychia lemnae]|eukprot:CDW71232.1 UNKNOWN [Stylonychia lemnae]